MRGAIGAINRMVHHRTPHAPAPVAGRLADTKRVVVMSVPHVVSRRGGAPGRVRQDRSNPTPNAQMPHQRYPEEPAGSVERVENVRPPAPRSSACVSRRDGKGRVIRRELFDVDGCTETPSDPLKGWATSVLLEAGATRECEEHGWMIDRADPQAHDRAFDIARRDPPPGISPKAEPL
jgi:hypothetical protein